MAEILKMVSSSFREFVTSLDIEPATDEELEWLNAGLDGPPVAERTNALTQLFLRKLVTRISNHTIYGKHWEIISSHGVNESSAALVIANAHGVRVMVFAAQEQPLPVPKEFEPMWKFNPDLTRDLGHAYTVYQTRSDSAITIKDSAEDKGKCIPWIEMGVKLAKKLAKS